MGDLDSSRGPMTKDQLAHLLVERIKTAGEPGDVRYDAEKGSLSKAGGGILNLENAYKEYSTADDSLREKIIKKWVRAWFLPHKEMPDEFEDVQPDLMPAIRGRGYFELNDLRMQLDNEGLPAWPHQPVGTHLALGLVYDMHEAMRAIKQSDLDQWGLTFYEAQEVALDNLRNLNHAFIGPESGAGVYMSANRDSYDASRLMMLEIIKTFNVKGDTVAMVPNRDTLIVTGSEDTEGLTAMLAITKDAVRQPGFVSTIALRLEDEEWVPWLPPPEHPLFNEFKLLRMASLDDDYGTQKALLDKLHAKTGEDVFVSSFKATQNEKTGRVASYGVWVAGITSWIPATDVVAFVRDPNERPRMYDWERVVQVLGDLMDPLDVYPERYLIQEFPSDAQFAALGEESKL